MKKMNNMVSCLLAAVVGKNENHETALHKALLQVRLGPILFPCLDQMVKYKGLDGENFL